MLPNSASLVRPRLRSGRFFSFDNFVLDAAQYRETKLSRPLPTLILHGIYDEVIPIQASRNFARNRPWVQLIELESDRALTNVLSEIWDIIKSFCQLSRN